MSRGQFLSGILVWTLVSVVPLGGALQCDVIGAPCPTVVPIVFWAGVLSAGLLVMTVAFLRPGFFDPRTRQESPPLRL